MRLKFALFLFVLILGSCSIQKRVYMPGYSVQFNKPASNNPVQSIKNTPVASIQHAFTPSITSTPSKAEIKVGSLKTVTQSKEPAIKLTAIKNEIPVPNFIHSFQTANDSLSNKNNSTNSRQVYGPSIVSFCIGLVLLLLPLILIPFGYNVVYPPGADDSSLPYYIFISCLLWLILAIVSFVNGIKAHKYIRNNLDKYKGLGYATNGIAISSIILAFLAVILLIILILIVTNL